MSDVEQVLNALKVIRRGMIRNGEVMVHESVVQHILSAATLPTYGERSMEKYIAKRYPEAIKISNEHLHKHHPQITQTFEKMHDPFVMAEERLKVRYLVVSLFDSLSLSLSLSLDLLVDALCTNAYNSFLF